LCCVSHQRWEHTGATLAQPTLLPLPWFPGLTSCACCNLSHTCRTTSLFPIPDLTNVCQSLLTTLPHTPAGLSPPGHSPLTPPPGPAPSSGWHSLPTGWPRRMALVEHHPVSDTPTHTMRYLEMDGRLWSNHRGRQIQLTPGAAPSSECKFEVLPGVYSAH
jgi:hypothetical protein